jgi:hypothetical protein
VISAPAAPTGAEAQAQAQAQAQPTPPAEPDPPWDPRTPARLLASVMVADGSLRAVERRFIAELLERERLAPLASDDLHVWRPSELGAPPDDALRDRLLEAAIHLMYADGQRDDSEWRVICTFGRAWGAPEERLDGWDERYARRYGSLLGRLGRALSSLLR